MSAMQTRNWISLDEIPDYLYNLSILGAENALYGINPGNPYEFLISYTLPGTLLNRKHVVFKYNILSNIWKKLTTPPIFFKNGVSFHLKYPNIFCLYGFTGNNTFELFDNRSFE